MGWGYVDVDGTRMSRIVFLILSCLVLSSSFFPSALSVLEATLMPYADCIFSLLEEGG